MTWASALTMRCLPQAATSPQGLTCLVGTHLAPAGIDSLHGTPHPSKELCLAMASLGGEGQGSPMSWKCSAASWVPWACAYLL